MNFQVDDQMAVLSQHNAVSISSQSVPKQENVGKSKPRRQRWKNSRGDKGVANGNRKLSKEQVSMLEKSFQCEQKLEPGRKNHIAAELGLDPRQVVVWFQNRRVQWRNNKMKAEYAELNSQHVNVTLENRHLQIQLLKLEEQLNEAEKKIQWLTELRSDGFSSNSSTSFSFSMEQVDQPFLGEFGLLEGLDNNLFYVPENVMYGDGLEWKNVYNM